MLTMGAGPFSNYGQEATPGGLSTIWLLLGLAFQSGFPKRVPNFDKPLLLG